MQLSSSQLQVVLDYITEDAPVIFFLLNTKGLVIDVNTYTRNTLGGPVIGSFFDDLLLDFKKKFNLEEYSRTDTPHLLSMKIVNAGPKSFHFTFRKTAESILVFGKEDVEELDLLRSELFRTNQELNNLMRTLHKKNGQLAHLNTLKNQFLGMAAHDLRKPLSVILSYSEFLIDEVREQLNKEQTSFLNRIKQSSLFMKRLVDDFLDVSVIEAGGFQLQLKQTNPADILERSLVIARMQAHKKNVVLNVEVDPRLPNIPLDGDKIEQAMSNLLSNAIEHSVSGKCVSVALKEVDDKIRFSVRDCGPGMSPEVLNQLFTPFSRTGSNKTAGEKSTGLGLTITSKIIDAHKGQILVESEEGSGTTFTIIFADTEE